MPTITFRLTFLGADVLGLTLSTNDPPKPGQEKPKLEGGSGGQFERHTEDTYYEWRQDEDYGFSNGRR